MKIIQAIAFLIMISTRCQAQAPPWSWAKGLGASNDDYGLSVAVDPSGNVYGSGYFQGIVDFDPGPDTFNLTSVGSRDMFLVKFDEEGNFIWAISAGGSDYDEITSIAFDSEGHVYTTGSFGQTVDFDPGTGVYNLTAVGLDFFVLKLDSSGNFMWVTQTGGMFGDWGRSICMDYKKGALYVTGGFAMTADFDPGPGIYNLTATGQIDIFILKLDTAGNFVWAKAISGGAIDTENGFFITVDNADNVYTTGYYQGTCDFDPGPGTFNLTTIGQGEIYLSKLDSSGNFIWAKPMSGNGSLSRGYSLAIDSSGNADICIAGGFRGTVDFDPGPGTYQLTSVTGGYDDTFIARLDSSGNFLWVKAIGGQFSDPCYSIAIDYTRNSDIIGTGYFSGTVDFDPDTSVFDLFAAGNPSNTYLLRLTSAGNFVWAKGTGGNSWDTGQSLAIDAFGYLYVTGYYYSSSILFDSTMLTNTDNTGNTSELFIAKLDTGIATTTGINTIQPDDGIHVYPNPFTDHLSIKFADHTKSAGREVIFELYDLSGRKVFTAELNSDTVVNLRIQPGMYLYTVRNENGFFRQGKLVKQKDS